MCLQFKNILSGLQPPVKENLRIFPPIVLISYVSYEVLLGKKGVKLIFIKKEF